MKRIITAVSVSVVLAATFTGCSDQTKQETSVSAQPSDNTAEEAENTVTDVTFDNPLIIPIEELSGDARFYTVKMDGTEMEVIAVKDSEGTVRTAFNTCQVCYDSGNGYYVQEGDKLVCQNCGNSFTMDQVGESSVGCNPWPITDEDKTMTENGIEIPYNFLKTSADIFANWKKS